MSMILSSCSSPSSRSCAAGTSPEPISRRDAARNSVSITSVDLPPPETPVTQVNTPSGMAAVTSLRLLPRAPTTRRTRFMSVGRRFGTGMPRRPLR